MEYIDRYFTRQPVKRTRQESPSSSEEESDREIIDLETDESTVSQHDGAEDIIDLETDESTVSQHDREEDIIDLGTDESTVSQHDGGQVRIGNTQQSLAGYDFDPASQLPINRSSRDYVISRGPCQPKDVPFSRDPQSGRAFRSEWYTKPDWKDWLEYSSKTQAAFCFYCRAFVCFLGIFPKPIELGTSNLHITCRYQRVGRLSM